MNKSVLCVCLLILLIIPSCGKKSEDQMIGVWSVNYESDLSSEVKELILSDLELVVDDDLLTDEIHLPVIMDKITLRLDEPLKKIKITDSVAKKYLERVKLKKEFDFHFDTSFDENLNALKEDYLIFDISNVDRGNTNESKLKNIPAETNVYKVSGKSLICIKSVLNLSARKLDDKEIGIYLFCYLPIESSFFVVPVDVSGEEFKVENPWHVDYSPEKIFEYTPYRGL